MDKCSFQLKRSYLALLFQLGIFCVLMTVLYQLLPLALWCGFLLLGGWVYLMFYRKTPQITGLDYLDGKEWTLSASGCQSRAQISHIIDHQAYVVVYFQHARTKPIIVWCDQMPFRQWKSFKILAKMI
ncbi:hypothetical protein [Acinetobacter pragensis]|uniref:hypothetical protein n=1 Tax=Acinetobacter pragensis TaxID=1806892 RepID=UPI00334177C8